MSEVLNMEQATGWAEARSLILLNPELVCDDSHLLQALGYPFHDGRDEAAPWLYGIATNLLRRWFRTLARGRQALSRAGDAEVSTDELDELVERIDAEYLSPELASALFDLPPADRDTLLMHALADLTYEQIARATGVPPGTVASRINRARARVRATSNHWSCADEP